jgi:outer membrane protein, multidrug efflux system
MNQSVSSSDAKHKKRAIAIAIAIAGSFLLVLPSCIPHLRNPEPGPILPDSFNGVTSSENSSQVTIEEFFNDPLLTGVIHQALVGNQELRILAEEVQIASNEILARQGAYLPFISPTGAAGLTRYSVYSLEHASIRDDPVLPATFLPNPLPNFLLGTSFLWTPDIYWQLHNAQDAAAMRYFAAGEGRKYVVTSVVAEIADTYFGLLSLDKRLENLDNIIALQQESLRLSRLKMGAGLGNDLAVRRFEAEVRKNQSEKLIVLQDIIQAENRINFLAGRYPQPVARPSGISMEDYIDLKLHALSVGVPAELLRNRPDVRRAERELVATGLDVKVARKNFYPKGLITGFVGYQAFEPRYLFITPEAIAGNLAGNMVMPLINRKAIKADYFTANARQLQAVYNYQRVVLNAFTEVVTRLAKVQNYLTSIEIRKGQVEALVLSVDRASRLFQAAQAEYIDVLLAQRDLWDARRILIDTKREQLSAIVNTYQALGGGAYLAQVLAPQVMQPELKRHFLHFHGRGPEAGPPGPPPAPVVAADGPPEPPPTPADGPPEPPPTPAAGTGPVPPLTPPAATSLDPLPTPMPGGNGPGTGSGTNARPR